MGRLRQIRSLAMGSHRIDTMKNRRIVGISAIFVCILASVCLNRHYKPRNLGGRGSIGLPEVTDRSAEEAINLPFRKKKDLVQKLIGPGPGNEGRRMLLMDIFGGVGENDPHYVWLKEQWKKNTPNMTVVLFGNVIGYLPQQPYYTRFYYPEWEYGHYDDLNFRSMRFVRKIKLQKDKFLFRLRYILHDLCLKPARKQFRKLRKLGREQAGIWAEVGTDAVRFVGDQLIKRQDILLQGAAAAGALTAVGLAMKRTVLDPKWRLQYQFVSPGDDIELEPGTMVYAPFVQEDPAQNAKLLMQQQQQRQDPRRPPMGRGRGPPDQEGQEGQEGQEAPKAPPPEPQWLLCEVQRKGTPGETVSLMAYANRMELEVPYEDLKLARSADQFLLTAMQGNPSAMMASLEETGASINTRDMNGNTALLTMCESGNKPAITALLEAGANPNMANFKGVTPLILAVTRGQMDLINTLLDYGARINKALPDGKTALYQAVASGRLEVVELLIDRGARINQLNNKQVSPLFVACQNGDLATVRLLLSRGAGWNINVAPDLGGGNRATPLFMATQKGHLPVIQALVEAGADLDKGTLGGKTKATPLMVAAQNGQGPIISYLLDMGADPDKRLPDGSVALTLAVQFGHVAIAQMLINAGCNIDSEDYKGNTALHIAVQTKQQRMVQLLLDAGADANIFTLQKRHSPLLLALHIAIESQGPLDIAKMLIPASAKCMHYADENGENALCVAVQALKGRNETDLIIDMLKTGTDPFLLTRKTGGKKKPRPKNNCILASAKAKRPDLTFVIKMFDIKNPDKIYELLEQRRSWYRNKKKVMDEYRKPLVKGFAPERTGYGDWNFNKAPLTFRLNPIIDDIKKEKGLDHSSKDTIDDDLYENVEVNLPLEQDVRQFRREFVKPAMKRYQPDLIPKPDTPMEDLPREWQSEILEKYKGVPKALNWTVKDYHDWLDAMRPTRQLTQLEAKILEKEPNFPIDPKYAYYQSNEITRRMKFGTKVQEFMKKNPQNFPPPREKGQAGSGTKGGDREGKPAGGTRRKRR